MPVHNNHRFSDNPGLNKNELHAFLFYYEIERLFLLTYLPLHIDLTMSDKPVDIQFAIERTRTEASLVVAVSNNDGQRIGF